MIHHDDDHMTHLTGWHETKQAGLETLHRCLSGVEEFLIYLINTSEFVSASSCDEMTSFGFLEHCSCSILHNIQKLTLVNQIQLFRQVCDAHTSISIMLLSVYLKFTQDNSKYWHYAVVTSCQMLWPNRSLVQLRNVPQASEKYLILAFALRNGLSTEFTHSSYLGNTSKPNKLQRGHKNIKTESERGNTSQASQSTDVGMLEKSWSVSLRKKKHINNNTYVRSCFFAQI